MKPQSIQEGYTRKEIERQVENRENLERKKKSIDAQIVIAEKIIKALSTPEQQNTHIQSPSVLQQPTDSSQASIVKKKRRHKTAYDKYMTLDILKQHASSDTDGIQIKYIKDKYLTAHEINALGRIVFRHIEELMNEGKVEQVNAPARRSRRYRVIKKIQEDVDASSWI